MAKPFVKWAGGKGQLLDKLLYHFPKTFGRYYEPFAGGGAVFFALEREERLQEGAVLLDICKPLIEAYEAVRDSVEALIIELDVLQNEYAKKRDKAFFYDVREHVNIEGWDPARFIFLNRTCFNGLFRLNRKGRFNVPEGRYKNPRICDALGLRQASEALQEVRLASGDFASMENLEHAQPGDLVYFDPPYVPVKADSFTKYSSDGFTPDDHERLASLAEKLVQNGVHVVVSNSDVEWVRHRYQSFEQHTIWADRMINSKKGGRDQAVTELILVGRPK